MFSGLRRTWNTPGVGTEDFIVAIETQHSCHLHRMQWAELTVCTHSANQAEVLVLAAGSG